MSLQNKIGQGALTNSKRPSVFVQGVYPTHVSKAHDCYLYDLAGHRYVDYVCALGTNYFGYGHPEIAQAAHQASLNGVTFSLPSQQELEFAIRLTGITQTEKAKFLNSGTESCLAAIKIARAKTGRKIILSQGYHGWGDAFVGLTPPALGVIADPYVKPLTDLDSVNFSEVAGVIIEPIVTEITHERLDYVRRLESLCNIHNVCLIFDETITGYRFAYPTVAQTFNFKPNLIIMGKALANGYPISAILGEAAYLDEDYFVSGTYFGNLVSLAAASKCLDLFQTTHRGHNAWSYGEIFLEKFNALTPHLKIDGYPTRGVFKGDELYKAIFWQESCLAGILFGPSWFYNQSLHRECENTINLCKGIVSRINNGEVTLKGKIPQTPFAQKVRL